MELLTNLFLLSHQLCLTSGLRVLDNGLGFAVYGSEESIGDYALLASDKKAALPIQVHELCHCWYFASFSVHHLLVCNCGGFVNQHPLLSTSPPVWGTLDHTTYAALSRIPLNGDATSRLISIHFHKTSFDPNYLQLISLTQNPSIYIILNIARIAKLPYLMSEL